MTDRLRHLKTILPVFGIFLTLTAFASSSNVIPPLITTIAEEIAADYTNLGYIIMLQFFSFFIAGIIGGWICERYSVNCRSFVLIGLLLVGLALLVGSKLTKLHWFIIWAIPLGLGGGLAETFGTILVSNHEKPNSSKLLNLSQVFFCIGAISAPQIVAIMLYIKISWQYIFILFGLFILFILCIFFLLTRKEGKAVAHLVQPANNFPTPLTKDSLFFLLSSNLLVYVTFESIVVCWISVYFEKQLLCPVYSAALRLSIFWFGLILGRLTVIVIPRRFTLWPVMFTGIAVMFASSLLASFTFSPLLATVFVFISGFGAGPIWPTTVAICHSARKRPKFTSAVIAIGAVGVGLGSWFGSIIFKYLDSSLFFPSVAAGCILLFVLSLFSYRNFSKTCRREQ